MVRGDTFLGFLQMKGFECRCAFDVGTFRGEWTQWILRKWPQIPTYMVEPITENHKHLNDLCQKHKNLHLIPVAASTESGTSEIAVGESLSGASMSPQPGQKWDHLERRQVETMALDDIVKKYETPIPDIVKIDVAGHELEVLNGADSLLGKTQVFILKCSIYPPSANEQPIFYEIAQYMAKREYYTFDITGFYRRSKATKVTHQVDLIFVHRNSQLWRPSPR